MAAPHVTGTAALCLQARSFAAADLRALLFRTATPAVTDRDRSGHGFLDIAATVQALPDGSDHRLRPRRRRVAGTTPTRDCGEVKPGSASATLVAIGPARLYRALAYRRGPIPGWIDATYSLLARPGQVPSANPAAGDLLLRVALGELGSGFAAVLLGPPMVRSELRASQVNAEGGGPGMYALVIDCGESPPNDDRRVALRILDSRGRVPAGQMLLRPRASSPEGQATLPR